MKNRPDTMLQPAHSFDVEDAYSIIIDNVDDSYMVVDTNLNIVFANRAAIKGLKERLGVHFTPGMSVLKLVSPERLSFLRNLYKDVLSGTYRTSEVSFTNEAGTQVYFENQFRPAKTVTGEITGVIVVSRDITEKKHSEQSLRAAEERWRFALEGSNQGVWDCNIQTGEVVYSDSYLKMYGYDESDLKNNIGDWMERIHPDDRERMRRVIQNIIKDEHTQYESTYRIKTKKGDYKWILAKGTLIKQADGKPLRLIGIHTDLTDTLNTEEELKRTYEEIRIANERFNIMMKATHDMIWDWDIHNNYIYRSEDGLKKVYGVENNESIQTIDRWLERIHSDDFAKAQAVINEILQSTDRDTFDIEYRFRRDDGSYSYVYDRGMMIRNEDGKPIRMIGAAQDISERKKLELEILKNELEHQRFINQATVETQELERSEIGKELHDNVNQVLTTTKLYLDLALTNNDVKRELVEKSISNIVAVINEIRQLSRSLMDPAIDDLGIVDSIKDLIENINLTKKLHVDFSVDPSIEELMTKTQKLTTFRIIQEALNNVIRHAKASNVLLSLGHEDNFAELSVEDNGIGFEPGAVKKGAGLKNIQNRVYLINGTHNFQCQINKGCKLVIRFPLNNQTTSQ